MARIKTGQFTFDAARYHEEPRRYDRVLARARASGEVVQCLCAIEPRPLVVRQIRGVHYLAVWPLDGLQHSVACPFRRASTALAASGIDAPASPDALADLDLSQMAAAEAQHEAATTVDGAVDLARLLGQLWSRAGLQNWPGGKAVSEREWSSVARRVLVAARGITVHGIALADILLVPPLSNAAGGWEETIAQLRQQRERRLLLARLRSIQAVRYGWRLHLEDVASPIFTASSCRHALLDQIVRVQQAESFTAGSGLQQVVLLDVQVSAGLNVSCVDGFVQPASLGFVLCEDSHDAKLIDQLARSGRAFERWLPAPCRAADEPPATDDADVDLLLRDAGGDAGVAMVLLRGEAAHRDAAPRLVRRLAQGKQVWVWDLGLSSQMPPLPAAAER